MTRCTFFVLSVVMAVMALVAPPVGAQDYEPPRTTGDKPDLQGVWDFRTLTPLQRPEGRGDQAVLSAEEVAELDAQSADRERAAFAPSEVRDEPLPAGGDVGAYNSYWVDQGASVVDGARTALIVEPSNGRLPDLAPGVEMVTLSLGADLPGERPIRVRAAGIGVEAQVQAPALGVVRSGRARAGVDPGRQRLAGAEADAGVERPDAF